MALRGPWPCVCALGSPFSGGRGACLGGVRGTAQTGGPHAPRASARAVSAVPAFTPPPRPLRRSWRSSCACERVIAPGRHRATHAPARPPRHPRGPIRRGGVRSRTRVCETTHPAGEHGFEAGGYSDCGHSFTAGPKGLTHVRYTPPASAQPSPLKGADMREGRGKRGGPGPQPGARRPNLAPSHCDNRCIQPGCTRALLMCGGPTVLPGETCWERQSQDSPRLAAPQSGRLSQATRGSPCSAPS